MERDDAASDPIAVAALLGLLLLGLWLLLRRGRASAAAAPEMPAPAPAPALEPVLPEFAEWPAAVT